MSRGPDRKKRPKKPKPVVVPSWKLVFEDHFEYLDLTRWQTQYPWGRDRRNVGELQYYAEDAFRAEGSLLRIIASQDGPPGFRYSSGLISSHESFVATFGRFEIRCRSPRGRGLWPAFWLLPIDTSWPPEIDVMEIIGSDPRSVSMTYHEQVDGMHTAHGTEFRGPDFSADFHVFTTDWEPDRLVWYVDGVERHRVETETPRVPMYLIVNLAVGGHWPGDPDGSTRFPAFFDVDYVRAWRRD